MADELEVEVNPESGEVTVPVVEATVPEPSSQTQETTTVTPPAPSLTPLEERMIQADLQSQALIRQMVEQDRARQTTSTEPVIPRDILEGAAPIVKAVLGDKLKEIDEMKVVLGNMIAENQGTREKSYIISQVPDWEDVKVEVAKHIHGQLDVLGVPPDPNIRRQYFNPAAVVATANLLKAQRGTQTTTTQTPDSLKTRSVVEGRGAGTTPATVTAPIDYANMSQAEFDKAEAKIQAARMRRNSG